MKQYWPNEQGTKLNNEVANLFLKTKKKFQYNLSNKTNSYLYIDILNNSSKSHLFNITLKEIEILILDIVEIDLKIKHIQLLNQKILYNLIQKILKHFISILNYNSHKVFKLDQYKISYNYLKIILLEHRLLLENLLIYLIFGSSIINQQTFVFNNINTPKEHVSILLENLIITASNLVIFILIENFQSLSKTAYFLIKYKLCNKNYLSNRSLALFKNYLIWQNLIYLYINQPKAIYSARYKIWLISSNGLIARYIYISRLDDFPKLSRIQLVFLFFIEAQDILIPQIEKICLILGRVILYISINVIVNSAIFLIRTLIKKLYKTS
uniref:Ycf55 n=1 Tax=Inkyuleea mariana TaxID=123988 RepID=A0A4D6X028_9FLOR|nr:hypothetical protein [Inkyuleea mariana]